MYPPDKDITHCAKLSLNGCVNEKSHLYITIRHSHDALGTITRGLHHVITRGPDGRSDWTELTCCKCMTDLICKVKCCPVTSANHCWCATWRGSWYHRDSRARGMRGPSQTAETRAQPSLQYHLPGGRVSDSHSLCCCFKTRNGYMLLKT